MLSWPFWPSATPGRIPVAGEEGALEHGDNPHFDPSHTGSRASFHQFMAFFWPSATPTSPFLPCSPKMRPAPLGDPVLLQEHNSSQDLLKSICQACNTALRLLRHLLCTHSNSSFLQVDFKNSRGEPLPFLRTSSWLHLDVVMPGYMANSPASSPCPGQAKRLEQQDKPLPQCLWRHVPYRVRGTEVTQHR